MNPSPRDCYIFIVVFLHNVYNTTNCLRLNICSVDRVSWMSPGFQSKTVHVITNNCNDMFTYLMGKKNVKRMV